MTLDARRIALQGIGYAALFVALQGFAPAQVPAEDTQHHDGAGGSSVGRGQLSLAEYLRKFGAVAHVPAEAEDPKTRRRRKDDEEVFAMLADAFLD